MNSAMFLSEFTQPEMDQLYQLGLSNYFVFTTFVLAGMINEVSQDNWGHVLDALIGNNIIDQTRYDALAAAWTADLPNQSVVTSN